MNDELEHVLSRYGIADMTDVTPLSAGLIHQTYLIETNEGNFILQQLHSALSSEEIGEDFKAVTHHLKERDFYAAQLAPNRDGETLTKIDDAVWRMQTALPGVTHDVVKSPAMAKNAGSMLARFHKALADIEHDFKTDVVLHETEKEYEKLLKAAKLHADLLGDVQKEYDFLVEELPKLFLPKTLPKRAMHGDPKISNVLFDGFENALSVIDLDTCNTGSVLCDIGDAMRSWCGAKEDDPKNCFNEEVYEAAIDGYLAEADFMTEEEKMYIPQAIGAITLELAARFLADYFNDSYFGWDDTRYKNRREHNLARCRGQITLYKDLKEKLGLEA